MSKYFPPSQDFLWSFKKRIFRCLTTPIHIPNYDNKRKKFSILLTSSHSNIAQHKKIDVLINSIKFHFSPANACTTHFWEIINKRIENFDEKRYVIVSRRWWKVKLNAPVIETTMTASLICREFLLNIQQDNIPNRGHDENWEENKPQKIFGHVMNVWLSSFSFQENKFSFK